MLSKKQRFSRDSFPKGRPTQRRSFSWGTVSVYTSDQPGASVVVSKKTLKKAHDRARAKRRIYSALGEISLPQGLVVHLRREALTAPFATITEDLKSITG